MTVVIKIEQFDNGISLKWTDAEGNSSAIVALDRDKEMSIGKMIWEDVQNAMNSALNNEVTIEVNYIVPEE